MYYSLLDIRTGARNKVDEYQTQRIQNTELDGYINDAKDQLLSIVFPLNENYFTRETFSDIESGTQEYEIPEEAKALVGIDVSSDGGNNYYTMKERNIDRRNINTDYFYNPSFPYSYFFRGNNIVLLSGVTIDSTNGLKWQYIWEHWDLNYTDTIYQATVTAATRASDVISLTTLAAHNVVDEQLITLGGMADSSFNGTFRVLTVPTTATLTLRQLGMPDDAGASNTGTLYRRLGLDVPGGRTAKRYIEAWVGRRILVRNEKATAEIDKDIAYLAGRLKKNLNYRMRGRTKKVRQRGTYGDAIVTPYSRRWRY